MKRQENKNGQKRTRERQLAQVESLAEPLLITVAAVAEMLGVSINSVWGMDAAGKIPSPIRFGRRCTRWRRHEIETWVSAGCPSRDQWEAMR